VPNADDIHWFKQLHTEIKAATGHSVQSRHAHRTRVPEGRRDVLPMSFVSLPISR
jgi:hypothetical protein